MRRIAQDGETALLTGDELLARATDLNRVMGTRDIRFKALAEHWPQRWDRFFRADFAHQLRATIGQLVADLELIAQASDQDEWVGMVEELPLR